MRDYSSLKFDWDEGNTVKNRKHDVLNKEAEEVFFNEPKKVYIDKKNSNHREIRFGILGLTNKNRKLSIVFTVRNNKIRIITARPMSREERKKFENA